MIDIIGSVTQGLYQSSLDKCIVGPFTKEITGAMKVPLALRHSCLLAQCAVTQGSTMLGGILALLFPGQYDTYPCLLITWHLYRVVAVIINRNFLRGCKPLDIIPRCFTIIFNFHGGQKVTLFFVGYVTMVLDLSSNSSCMYVGIPSLVSTQILCSDNLPVSDITICLIALPNLHKKWRHTCSAKHCDNLLVKADIFTILGVPFCETRNAFNFIVKKTLT